MIHGQHGQIGTVCFPIFAAEGADVDPADGRGLKAAYIDTIAVGIRTRNIKGLDAACLTEEMFGNTRVELIRRKLVGSVEQPEARLRHDQMQETAFAADRTVTFEPIDLGRRVDLKANPFAVASAAMAY
jgi:hypothetical protein